MSEGFNLYFSIRLEGKVTTASSTLRSMLGTGEVRGKVASRGRKKACGRFQVFRLHKFIDAEGDLVERFYVFVREGEAERFPGLKFLNRLAYLFLDNALKYLERDFACFMQQAAERHVGISFLVFQGIQQLRLTDESLLDPLIAYGLRIGRERLEDLPFVKKYGADVVAGLNDQFARPRLHSEKEENIRH
ncbi:MAG TPA: hypothetical protein VK654_09475 [Nitrospirota bacterium]|nr:hypothetical protein [Nitrospirota bacterium]